MRSTSSIPPLLKALMVLEECRLVDQGTVPVHQTHIRRPLKEEENLFGNVDRAVVEYNTSTRVEVTDGLALLIGNGRVIYLRAQWSHQLSLPWTRHS